MGKKLILLMAVVLLPFVLFAGGETGADILNEKTGVRPLSLGEAYTAFADDLEGVLYNPACLSYVKSRELTGSYLWKSFKMTSLNGAYAQPIEIFFLDGTGSISFIYRTVPEIANVDAEDPPVTFYDLLVTATFANNLYYFIKNDFLKYINAGLSVKFIQEQIGDNVGSTFAFDSGLIFSPEDSGYKLGISLLNVGIPIRTLRGNASETDFDYGASPLPLTLRLGGSFLMKIDKDNTTKFGFDFIQNFYKTSQVATGIEHNIVNILYLRVGYNMFIDDKEPASLSAGIGVSIMTTVPITITGQINYVYRIFMWNWFNSPDSVNAISVVFKF